MESTVIERDLFAIGMWWRICYGTFRVAVGIFLIRFINQPFPEVLRAIFRNELIESPNDLLATQVMHFFQHHSFEVTFFFAFYVIFWGLVDIILSVCLLKHQLWAFPFSLLLITSFMIYEVGRFMHTGSKTLLVLLAVDSFVFWLIYREYQRMTLKLADRKPDTKS